MIRVRAWFDGKAASKSSRSNRKSISHETFHQYSIVLISLFIVGAGLVSQAAADLSVRGRRKLIARVPESSCLGRRARQEVSSLGSSAVVRRADRTAFRLVKMMTASGASRNQDGQQQWEDVDMIARAVNAERSSAHAQNLRRWLQP